jgi:hypothetical protein
MFYALAGQSAVIVAGTLAIWLLWGPPFWPFLYGGSVASASAGLLVWRWKQGLRDYHCDGRRHLKRFYRSVWERFFVVVLLLAAGFWLGSSAPGFQPLAMLLGFIVGQLAWVIATAAQKSE